MAEQVELVYWPRPVALAEFLAALRAAQLLLPEDVREV